MGKRFLLEGAVHLRIQSTEEKAFIETALKNILWFPISATKIILSPTFTHKIEID